MNKAKIIKILEKYKEDILPEKNENLNKTISTERFGKYFDNFLRGLEKNNMNDSLMVNILGVTCKPVKTKIMDIYYKKPVEETPEEIASIEKFLDVPLKEEEIPIEKKEEIPEVKKEEEIREEIPVEKNEFLKVKINYLEKEINNLKVEIKNLKEQENSISEIKKIVIEESKKYNETFEKKVDHLTNIIELAYKKEVNGEEKIVNNDSKNDPRKKGKSIFSNIKWKEI